MGYHHSYAFRGRLATRRNTIPLMLISTSRHLRHLPEALSPQCSKLHYRAIVGLFPRFTAGAGPSTSGYGSWARPKLPKFIFVNVLGP